MSQKTGYKFLVLKICFFGIQFSCIGLQNLFFFSVFVLIMDQCVGHQNFQFFYCMGTVVVGVVDGMFSSLVVTFGDFIGLDDSLLKLDAWTGLLVLSGRA